MKEKLNVPKHYIPKTLTKKDREKQKKELKKSRKLYKKGKYYIRKKMKSFKQKPSKHKKKVEDIYHLKNKDLNINILSKKTKCTRKSLKKIVNKGMGAYYSSGSRPNQTPHSWGYARLYSAITGGPAAKIDKNILLKGCKKNSKAIQLLNDNFNL